MPPLDRLVEAALAAAPEASDYLFAPGRPPLALVHGRLTPLVPADVPETLTSEQTAALAEMLLARESRLQADLTARGACDLGYRHPAGTRFRVNVFRALGNLHLVLRRLPDRPPQLERLGLPPTVQAMAGLADGLVLVVGATGSGKSTTLASLLARIADTRPLHAITLEDPVEFLHAPRLGLVTQRELGTDFPDFAEGLRAALRQAPHVLLVGEMRDRATVDTALAAAETGHLVLATAHTDDCAGAITRLLAFFGPNEQTLARTRLSGCLRHVVAQRLLPRQGGGRVAAVEVLTSTLRLRERIAAGEVASHGVQDILEQGSAYGMSTFDAAIAGLFAAGLVSEEAALARATDRAATARALDTVKASRGQAVSTITGLTLEEEKEEEPPAARGAAPEPRRGE